MGRLVLASEARVHLWAVLRLLGVGALLAAAGVPLSAAAQVDEGQTGAWYMYFFNGRFGDGPWGVQGDVQLRMWEPTADLEQLLIRGGLTYTPPGTDVLITLGYGNVTSGVPGASSRTSSESRIYQEFLLPQRVGARLALRHRFRFEQRWVEGLDFRTRFRYALFVTVPLSRAEMRPGTVYLSVYDEVFINGQRDVGQGREVEYFDRNRLYGGLGYVFRDGLNAQLGYMQQTTDNWSKGQLQFSLHHSF